MNRMQEYRKSRLKQIKANKSQRKPIAFIAWVIAMFFMICSVDSHYSGWPWYVPLGFILLAFFIIHKGAMYFETGEGK